LKDFFFLLFILRFKSSNPHWLLYCQLYSIHWFLKR